jgi:hypothetical protein
MFYQSWVSQPRLHCEQKPFTYLFAQFLPKLRAVGLDEETIINSRRPMLTGHLPVATWITCACLG